MTCGKAVDGPLYIGKRTTNKDYFEKTEMEKAIHGQVVGFADKPCTECAALMEKGILLVVIDETESDMSRPPWEGWRTGHSFVVTTDYIERLDIHPQSLHDQIMRRRSAFIPLQLAKTLGLVKEDGTALQPTDL